MHHGENWGGEFCDDNDAFARVYNNLLLHEYIITLHQCTFKHVNIT